MGSMAADQSTPMVEMNMTPLIDVLLVLLVMFIITIPIQTHAIKLDLPIAPRERVPPPNPFRNSLVITQAGLVLWNGEPVSERALRYNLQVTQQMDPIPELHLRPEPNARYGVVDEVLGVIKQEQVQKVGFVGNEAYADL